MPSNVHVLDQQNTLFTSFIAELRDQNAQKNRLVFRQNLERIGNVMAYEISKTLTYAAKEITTPLGVAEMNVMDEQPVLATILRAGIPYHNGFLHYFDKADSAFISAYRNHKGDEEEYEIEVEYQASPSLEGKTLILLDTMLATGASIFAVYKSLKSFGKPANIHVASAIGCKEGLSFLQEHMPTSTTYWFGALDDELTAKSYIVPGLGDAGDLAYGKKVKPR